MSTININANPNDGINININAMKFELYSQDNVKALKRTCAQLGFSINFNEGSSSLYKKFIRFILYNLLCRLFNMLQSGWISLQFKSDDLSGGKDGTLYAYVCKEANLMFINDLPNLYLKIKRNIFDSIFGTNLIKAFTISLYDENQELIESISEPKMIGIDYGISFCNDVATMNNNASSIVSKVINHIKYKKGFVRIVASQFKEKDLDITIPCMGNDKPIKQ